MAVNILPAAEAEAGDAAVGLENARRGIGFDFSRAYDEALAEIAADPRRYPPAEDAPEGMDVRYYYLARFHYRIVYALLPGEILVVAVAHTSRRPGYWLTRLTREP
jgi:toxin ParE1/3/4